MKKKRLPLPAFIEVVIDGFEVYAPLLECKTDPDLTDQIVNKALAELEDWRNKYADLFAFLDHRPAKRVIKTIDRLKQKMGDQWPTSPDDLAEENPEEDDDEV